MTRREVGYIVGVAAAVVLGLTPLAPAPQEPGQEYVFFLNVNDANSIVHLDVGAAGLITDQVSLAGWVTLYLDSPSIDGAKCVLGRCHVWNTTDLLLEIPAPFNITGTIKAGDLDLFDLDVWYQDLDDWYVDPNRWPNPADAKDPNDAPDPNIIGGGNISWPTGVPQPPLADPNDPNYNDPNDTSINRWTTLSGDPVATGQLNSEPLYFWKFTLVPYGFDPNDPNYWIDNDADLEWSAPFRYWEVSLQEAENPDGGPLRLDLDWNLWIDTDLILGKMRLEGQGGIARKLTVTEVVHPENGTFVMDPVGVDVKEEETYAHAKYLDGTVVTLEAIPDPAGKGFFRWEIYDPNYPGTTGPRTLDTNTVTVLTMDADYVVKCKFKCGSASQLMPIGMVLLVLTMAFAVRRFK